VSGYIKISNAENHKAISELNSSLDSTTSINDSEQDRKYKKSCERFLHNVGDKPKIEKKIRAYATVSGINFLIEYQKLRDEAALSKWQRKTFWYLFGIAFIGTGLSAFNVIVTQCNSNTIPSPQSSIAIPEDTSATQLPVPDNLVADSLR